MPDTPWPADQVERRSVDALIPYAQNARTHSDAQVDQLAAAIREWGWTMPVLVDESGTIIAGHGRVMAARKLGIDEVPVMVARGWSEAQRRAYVLADNRLALSAGWDEDMLCLEFAEIEGLGFDLELTGFGLDEIGVFEVNTVDMPVLPDGDKGDFQQKTFTLHDQQAVIVDDAVRLARDNPLADTGINENTNGNALALICSQWLEGQHGGQ